MIFTILLAVFFAALVFIHYLQGLFSSTISAIIAVFAAVLAFSWHEKIAETWLPGTAPNVAESIILVLLFALLYLIPRVIIDKVVPNGVMLPAAIDKVGGALMGAVAATFALGIVAIATEELPFGSNIGGYTKYAAEDKQAQISGNGISQSQTGFNFDDLKSQTAGEFDEKGRAELFPVIMPGVDQIVVDTVAHLSDGGALSLPGDSLQNVHPDFLQEIYAQNLGIQAGAKHVLINSPSSPKAVIIEGFFVPVGKFQIADPYNRQVRSQPIAPPAGLDQQANMEKIETRTKASKSGDPDIVNVVQVHYAEFQPADKQTLLIARITFGPDAADGDGYIRMSPASVRLVAKKNNLLHDYYPIGTVEVGLDPIKYPDKRHDPILYLNKLDDYLILKAGKGVRRGVDLVFAVEKSGCVKPDNENPPKPPVKIDAGVFLEVKRMVRQDVGEMAIAPYSQPDPASIDLGTEKQMRLGNQTMSIRAEDVPSLVHAPPTTPTSVPAH